MPEPPTRNLPPKRKAHTPLGAKKRQRSGSATIQQLLTKALEFVMHHIPKILLACFAAIPVNAVVAQSPIVRFDGIGAVRVGMSLRDLNGALHTSYSRPSDPEERSCYYVDLPNLPKVGVMMLDGRVARVDVDNAVTPTELGIHNGDSEARALLVYGKRLKIEPHAYLPENGHFLTLFSPDRKYGIRFETEDGRIIRYYVGTIQAISFTEGCS
jgi:hypothetical protein